MPAIGLEIARRGVILTREKTGAFDLRRQYGLFANVEILEQRDIGQKPRDAIQSSQSTVGSLDTTKVRCWSLWTIQVLVAIDHFSRKVVCVTPLEGPNAGWIYE